MTLKLEGACSEDLYNLLGIQSVDWISMEVGAKCARTTLGPQPEWTIFRDAYEAKVEEMNDPEINDIK